MNALGLRFLTASAAEGIPFWMFAVVGGMLAWNGLPRLYHPSFNYSRSERATNDRFVVIVEAQDERFHHESTPQLLRSLGGRHVELVHE